MTYREAIVEAMDTFAALKPAPLFIGYGLSRGRAMGTLANVPAALIIETPVAENLMTGIACGVSLNGRPALVYFERADFLLNAADAIVNHVDKLMEISEGQFSPGLIIRATIGNRTKPLFTGPTHTQDLTDAFRGMCRMPVLNPTTPLGVESAYVLAIERAANGLPTLVFEYKDLM